MKKNHSYAKTVVALWIVSLIVMFGLGRQTQAAVIGNPNAGNGWSTTSAVSVTADSYHWIGPVYNEPINTINGSGLDLATGLLHDKDGRGMWLSEGVGGMAGPANPGTVAGRHWIRFAFDQVYALDQMWIWNQNEGPFGNNVGYGQGISNAVIEVSTTGGASPAEWTTVFNGVIPEANYTATDPVNLTLSLGGINAKYVVVTGFDTWSGGIDYMGLSEVRFSNLIPEPTTMALLGLGGLLLVARRRRHSPKKVAALGVVGLIAMFGLGTQAQATYIGNPNAGNGWSTTSAVSIPRHSGEASGREVIHTIDGSGMVGNVDSNTTFNGVTPAEFGMFRNPPYPSYNISAPNPGTDEGLGSHWGEYAFDQVYLIDNVSIWNGNEGPYPGFGWRYLEIQTSVTGGTNPSDWTTVYTGEIPMSDGSNGSAVDLVASFAPVTAKYVALINTGVDGVSENWSAGAYVHDAVLSEVRFSYLVPEPTTVALLGLGGLLLFVRRRRS